MRNFVWTCFYSWCAKRCAHLIDLIYSPKNLTFHQLGYRKIVFSPKESEKALRLPYLEVLDDSELFLLRFLPVVWRHLYVQRLHRSVNLSYLCHHALYRFKNLLRNTVYRIVYICLKIWQIQNWTFSDIWIFRSNSVLKTETKGLSTQSGCSHKKWHFRKCLKK